ncbi:MAG: hypothetical protein US74_C0006G0037 [Parcubacteria group bacterium GW2011_GWA2_38_13]|nr:MAG: hypothetical protein US74_C0006G0037 [Parcubacteria group bacterium GW2011_GWA2_38_13]
MIFSKKDIGNYGEKLAKKFLKRQGYKIIDKNYRTKSGEIDIIARDKESLVFVEVKTRSSAEFGDPEMNLHPRKIQNFRAATQIYISEKNINCGYSLDVISIDLSKKPPDIVHFKNITM